MTDGTRKNAFPGDVLAIISQVESCIGYRFANTVLLVEALTHKSYHNEHNVTWNHNERLEFLGDAVLDLVVSEYLMRMAPRWPEGKLTTFRASLVNESNLAQLACTLRLGPALLLGKGEEMNAGRHKPSILSDCIEAIVGAIFLDSNFEICKDAVLGWIQESIMLVTRNDDIMDPKTLLQQHLQSQGQCPGYTVVGIDGPDHNRIYEVEVVMEMGVLARGKGRSKKEAEKQAAFNSIAMLETQGVIEEKES